MSNGNPDLNDKISEYKTVISEKDVKIQNLSNQLTALSNRLAESEATIESLKNNTIDVTVVHQYESAIAERNNLIQQLNNQLAELNNKLAEANREISDSKYKINAFSDRISEKDDMIRKLNEEINSERMKPWYKKLFGK